METSRLFVKNLPPSINEADFRKHFSTGGRQVTDVKLIAKRRIGYVGYKTPQEAAKAVKYFNRSYIRMSRISVEPARPITESIAPVAAGPRHAANKLPTPEPELHKQEKDNEANSKKRKREEPDPSDPKLKEYLNVMRPGQTNASKLEGIMGQSIAEPDIAVPVIPLEAESDDEYEEIPAHKSKRSKDDAVHAVPPAQPTDGLPQDVPQPAAQDRTNEPQLADATDDDWMRSRTSRLLDLIDPNDPAALASVAPAPNRQPIEAAAPSPSQDIEMTDAVVESEPLHASTVDQADEDSATDQTRRTARLFIRNLPFKVTEAELRDHFAKYGQVEEVSLSSHTVFFEVHQTFSLSSNVMNPR